jgi:prolyl-tRNA synthetase
LPCGYIGPVELDIPIYADQKITSLQNFVTGANKVDTHFTGVQVKRDLKISKFGDLRSIAADDPCPKCDEGKYQTRRGIEVGHIFILGTKYSEAMKAVYLDNNGKECPMVMGCYGIGVGRTAAASIEQNHDEKGIVWPRNLAPFEVIIIPVNFKNDDLKKTCESLYIQLKKMGVEVVLDDRQDRLGGKLKDADLIGVPLQIIVGPKNLEEGKVEIKIRKTQESQLYAYPEVVYDIPNILKDL